MPQTIIRIPGIALWVFFLTLPFMSVKNSLLVGILLAAFWGVLSLIRHGLSLPLLNQWWGRGDRIIRSFCVIHSSKPVLCGGGLALLILLPLGLNNYYIDVLTLVGLYAVLASGLNIVVGLAGLLDLGYAAFYAIGAYLYGLLSTKAGVPFWVALPLGGAVAALFGVMLGIITLRLRGDYLAIVTLGFIQIVRLVLNNWDSVTNGPNGILGIARPAIGSFVFSEPIHFYYLILAICLVQLSLVTRLNNSGIGRAWNAIREDEIAAEAMGVDTTRLKILAFASGATWAGIAGVFFAAKFSFISPESFTFFESVLILSMVVFGGLGSIPGAILGAVILILLPELLRGVAHFRMLVFGSALVFTMIFRPQGLLGGSRRFLTRAS